MPSSPKIQRALVSVSDKTGLLPFVHELVALGVEIFSTGGTRRHLEEGGVAVRDVAQYTGFPEMLDGRVKTLHPKVHGGLLCRHDNPDDMAALSLHGIVPFELVVVNLYPFEQTVARPGVADDEAIEQIDIGGPSMIRSAAKNHAFVTVVTDAAQYGAVLHDLRTHSATTPELRRTLAHAAFQRTAAYDAAISDYFNTISSDPAPSPRRGGLGRGEEPDTRADLTLLLRSTLRYGENPHQEAALYAFPDAPAHSLVNAQILHGKELSYNNFLDLNAALALVRSLPAPAVAVLKHNNPCGAATAATLLEAVANAWDGDPTSAFGSVLGVNVPVNAAMANFLAEPGKFVECIIAPEFTPDALRILTTKPKWKDNVRLLATNQQPPAPSPAAGRAGEGGGAPEWRQISGGMLQQTADDLPDEPHEWKSVAETQPTDAQRRDLEFAWAVCRHVKSNAIVLVKNQAVVGVGAGQMSRVDAVEIAIRKASDRARGAALASDAFFPFPDSINAAAAAGVASIIQPGGSRRDDEVIAACRQHALPMLFTGRRHFRH